MLTRFYHQHKQARRKNLDVVDTSYYKSNENIGGVSGTSSKSKSASGDGRLPRRFFHSKFKNGIKWTDGWVVVKLFVVVVV